MIKNNFLQIIFAVSLFALSSCSVFSPVKTETQTTYVLNKLPKVQTHKKSQDETLLILPPQTSPLYNTKQMAYTEQHFQIGYFANHAWAQRPSDMLQPLIMQSLQNTHHYRAIVNPTFVSNYQYILSTEILELLQDYTHNPGVLRLSLRAQISRAADNQIIASKEFVITRDILQKSPYGGVVAANFATAQLLQELTEFCLKNT